MYTLTSALRSRHGRCMLVIVMSKDGAGDRPPDTILRRQLPAPAAEHSVSHVATVVGAYISCI